MNAREAASRTADTVPERLWAVMVACSWDAMKLPNASTTKVSVPNEMGQPCSFMPLFSTYESAVSWAGSNRDVVQMRLSRERRTERTEEATV